MLYTPIRGCHLQSSPGIFMSFPGSDSMLVPNGILMHAESSTHSVLDRGRALYWKVSLCTLLATLLFS